jgi:predicted enzyme related to lactoylglutathione lyase
MTATTGRLITGTDFIGIPTHDLETAVKFYGETLGLHRSAYRPDRHHAEFETGNLTINIMDAEKMGLAHTQFQNPLALHVDDVAAARETLERRGVTFMMDTVDTGVCHMAFFADTDGNALMLHHRYAPKQPDA